MSTVPDEPRESETSVNWDSALESTGGDELLAMELADTLLSEAPADMTKIQRAIAQSQFADLRLYAHKLKGELRIFGCPHASELAYRLERMGEQKGDAEAPQVFAELEAQMQLVLAEFRQRLNK